MYSFVVTVCGVCNSFILNSQIHALKSLNHLQFIYIKHSHCHNVDSNLNLNFTGAYAIDMPGACYFH